MISGMSFFFLVLLWTWWFEGLNRIRCAFVSSYVPCDGYMWTAHTLFTLCFIPSLSFGVRLHIFINRKGRKERKRFSGWIWSIPTCDICPVPDVSLVRRDIVVLQEIILKKSPQLYHIICTPVNRRLSGLLGICTNDIFRNTRGERRRIRVRAKIEHFILRCKKCIHDLRWARYGVMYWMGKIYQQWVVDNRSTNGPHVR